MKEFHPIANIFPLMQDSELNELATDILANGLREAIWLHEDGSIIDGRNRYRACLVAGVEPLYRTWHGPGSLLAFVVSANLHRRHLSETQRAVVAHKIANMHQGRPEKQANLPVRITQDDAGKLLSVSPRTIRTIARVAREAPDLMPAMEAGEMTAHAAGRVLVKRSRAEAPPMPTDKYRVLYADPPWHYGNKGLDDYGHAERHYPSMTIAELCAMGDDIKAITEGNAVLFMWVTSPLLEECFPVIKAWGFKYKTSFVWDKVRHNFGHYNSTRHEFLLICVRGSCTPDVQELFDSVQSIEKSRKHSEKPERFREIIDTLYPHGKRLELFARVQADGWEVWGNEPG